jgi:tripartite-type tricarboxylate transporter receptor subunit TctC
VSLSRRAVLALAGAVAGVGAIAVFRRRRTAGAAGACPAVAGRRIRWIVPHAVGGGYDAESRLIAPFLERRLQAEILVENLTGAGGVIGARTIADASPDGLTLGILGVPGLLAASLAGVDAPNPASEFSILGRVSRSAHVWAVGRTSPLATFESVLAAGDKRPLVFAISEVSSANFVSITGSASVLGVNIELVAGFGGNRQASLAAIRGDVDLVCFDYEAVRDLIESGDLRPLLQVSDEPNGRHAALRHVAILGGESGWAARRARDRGGDEAHARAQAAALVDLVGTGRVIVGPAGLAPATAACLAQTLHDVLVGDDLQAATRRGLDPAPAEVARADVQRAAAEAPRLLPVIRAALQKLRR